MKRLIAFPVLVVLLVGVFGCATAGKCFEFTGTGNLVIGKTSMADIRHQYGEPFRVGYDNGNMKWTYGYYKYRLFGKTETKDLAITFDEHGLIKSYSYSTSLENEKKSLLGDEK